MSDAQGNAKIKSTMLGFEDHGIFTAYITLEGDGWGQGFGGFTFCEPIKDGGRFLYRRGTAYAASYIMALLKALDLERWEQLPGTLVRYRRSGGGSMGKIESIGHIYKEQWFTPADIMGGQP